MDVDSMPAVGPLPRFAEAQVLRALQLIADKGPLGRKRLTEELEIGEGSMRTILNRLKKQGLITSSRAGHSMTAKGRRRLREEIFECVQVDIGNLIVGDFGIATIVRGAAAKVKRGIEQRDEAIKVGADGATVLVYRKGRFEFPDKFTDIKRYEDIVQTLIENLKPRERDVVIIGAGKDVRRAELGARAAAKTLI